MCCPCCFNMIQQQKRMRQVRHMVLGQGCRLRKICMLFVQLRLCQGFVVSVATEYLAHLINMHIMH
uniref:Similar to GRV2 (KATAMARI2) n=1 Tax=Arundo donax TaxID=35708 RepID=A0A0A9EZD5_ARUDO